MQHNTYFWLGVGVVIALLLAAGVLFLRPHAALAPGDVASSTSAGATTTIDLGGGVSVVGSNISGATITTTSNISAAIAAPSLNRQTTFSTSLSADQVAQLRSDEQASIAALKKDPTQANYWLQLAIDYKEAGDYQGAISIWTYLTKAMPASYVAFADLGDLYMNFQVNYPKAEANYLEAIKLNPTDVDLYSDLFTLYTSFYKTNTTAAADIVAQGLKANPNNPDLLQLQTQLK